MKYLLALIFLLPLSVIAQNGGDIPTSTANANDPERVFTFVEIKPEFKGGEVKLNEFLKNNFRITPEAKAAKLTGAIVVQFVVKRDGSITDPQVVQKKGYGLDEEMLRVVKLLPEFDPGKQNSRPVNFRHTLVLRFEKGELAFQQ